MLIAMFTLRESTGMEELKATSVSTEKEAFFIISSYLVFVHPSVKVVQNWTLFARSIRLYSENTPLHDLINVNDGKRFSTVERFGHMVDRFSKQNDGIRKTSI